MMLTCPKNTKNRIFAEMHCLDGAFLISSNAHLLFYLPSKIAQNVYILYLYRMMM